MHDEEIRALARAVEANPHDVALAHAYARALARVGDRPARLATLSALARRGDVEATCALAELTPWPSVESAVNGTRRSRRAAPRGLGHERSHRLPPLEHSRRFVAATDRVLLFGHPLGFEAVGIDDGGVSWEARQRHAPGLPSQDLSCCFEYDHPPAVARDDHFLIAFHRRLELRDAERGHVRSSAPLAEPVRALAVEGDRAALLLESGRWSIVDVGDDRLGRELWRLESGAPRLVGGLALVHVDAWIEARVIDSGNVVWRYQLGPRGNLLAADESGVLLRGRKSIHAVGLDGKLLWSHEPWDGDACVGREAIVVHRKSVARARTSTAEGEEVSFSVSYDRLSLDRLSGEVLWRRPVDKGQAGPHVQAAVCEDQLFVLTPEREGATLRSFDLATGDPRGERHLPALGSASAVVPLDRQVIAIGSSLMRAPSWYSNDHTGSRCANGSSSTFLTTRESTAACAPSTRR
jgi:hypothetical protein